MEINKLFKIISATTLAGIMFIGCGEKVTFKGQEYKVITSPITGKKWLDRNLGASQACTSSTDRACYGDYYQWGRLADGHEKASSSVTTIPNTDILNVGNSNFIIYTRFFDWTTNDWNTSQRTAQWNKLDGTGVCPKGFRVPTIIELKNETLDYVGMNNKSTGAVKVINSATAFENFLKLPVDGFRLGDGSLRNDNSTGRLWTVSVDGTNSHYISFENENADSVSFGFRAMGIPVRCVGI